MRTFPGAQQFLLLGFLCLACVSPLHADTGPVRWIKQDGSSGNRFGTWETGEGYARIWLNGSTKMIDLVINQPIARDERSITFQYFGIETRGNSNQTSWYRTAEGQIVIDLTRASPTTIDANIRKTHRITTHVSGTERHPYRDNWHAIRFENFNSP
ncbi:MAG: hypothetical protein H8E44_04205 [Planctomycetes bacterium]|nr:hypothetical protein [Planctomycetota bacterium]MBL7044225.1 hypothetical protein [Pirellulaceae bacterium]